MATMPLNSHSLTNDNVSDEQNLKMEDVGSFYIPKHRTLSPNSLGEDAHFVCSEHQTIGVADGVGGCASRGIDAGEYARQLMKNCVEEIQKLTGNEDGIVPQVVLSRAYDRTDCKGSSTACIVTLKGSFLHALNVGDSGFIVIRRGRIVYRSPSQQYQFNCPYSLWKSAVRNPVMELGEKLMVAAQSGDIVVAGTDGLFDNVYLTELRKLVVEAVERGEVLARTIAEFALGNSKNRGYDSPFAKAARLAGIPFMGGKEDDITVVVAHIV